MNMAVRRNANPSCSASANRKWLYRSVAPIQVAPDFRPGGVVAACRQELTSAESVRYCNGARGSGS
jgi:hypothetical protein